VGATGELDDRALDWLRLAGEESAELAKCGKRGREVESRPRRLNKPKTAPFEPDSAYLKNRSAASELPAVNR
jgi:hypothetical protein